jgi:SAM-dependent methyltransferase
MTPQTTGTIPQTEPVAAGWQRRLLRRIPWGVRRFFDPHHYPRYQFVRVAAAEVRAGETVVDAGAGEAPFRALFDHARYVALDNMVGDAAWDYSRVSVVGDLLALPLRPGTVSHVLCNDVLEHIPNPQGLIDEIFRVLAPGGGLFLSAPQGWGEHQLPHDYFRFTSRGLTLLFERAGFEVRSIRPLGGFFYYLANRIQMAPLVLFGQRAPWARILLLPLEVLAHLVCGILLPLLLMPLDALDHDKLTTLTYACRVVKPPSGTHG